MFEILKGGGGEEKKKERKEERKTKKSHQTWSVQTQTTRRGTNVHRTKWFSVFKRGGRGGGEDGNKAKLSRKQSCGPGNPAKQDFKKRRIHRHVRISLLRAGGWITKVSAGFSVRKQLVQS